MAVKESILYFCLQIKFDSLYDVDTRQLNPDPGKNQTTSSFSHIRAVNPTRSHVPRFFHAPVQGEKKNTS